MPDKDPLNFLQTLLTRDFTSLRHHKLGGGKKPLVITLSRDYGALGEAIGQRLAQSLGIPLYDQEILDRVAERAKTDKFFFQPHDEQIAAGLTTFLYSLIHGTAATLQDYRRYLCEVVADIARHDCIIIGRGANLILAGKPAFRIRVVGSKLVCAQRIADEFHIPIMEAERKVYEINSKRYKSVVALFGDHFEQCSPENAKNFDLVINTDHISPEGAVRVILLDMREAGFFQEVPQCKP